MSHARRRWVEVALLRDVAELGSPKVAEAVLDTEGERHVAVAAEGLDPVPRARDFGPGDGLVEVLEVVSTESGPRLEGVVENDGSSGVDVRARRALEGNFN